jgi:EAL domain-containing protein (putative c-di-GMP-specific phosphodiesterase class I)
MPTNANFDEFVRNADGSYSWSYGSYLLHSAFQPIVEPGPNGLSIACYHGQIRIERMGCSYAPSEFLSTADPQDLAALDGQMAALHLANAHIYAREDATIHVARMPRFFQTRQEMTRDAARLRSFALGAGLRPEKVVCELRLREGDNLEQAAQFTAHMRWAEFQIGIDGYAGDERDQERVRVLKPNFIRFDPAWVFDLLKTKAGAALLGVIVEQFREQNITPLFSCLEDESSIETLEAISAPRLQGHALARPERAPATFSDRFHVRPMPAARDGASISPMAAAGESDNAASARRAAVRRAAPVFGKRGLG